MQNNSREKSLIKNTLIITIGTICTKLITFIMLPLYTLKLSTEQYGTVELLNTIITLLLPIICLQVDQGIFRFLIDSRKNKEETKKLISSSIGFVLFMYFIFFMLFLIFNIFINNKYKWLVIIAVFTSGISSLFMQIARGIGDNKRYSISNFLTSFFTILFNIIFLVGLNYKISGMMFGSICGLAIGIIYLFISLKIYSNFKVTYIEKKYIRKILKYSLPMIPNSISWWIFSSSDRIIISTFISLAATGILSIAYKFSSIGILVYNIFNMSLTESISMHIKDNDISIYFNKIFNKVGHFFVSFGSILIAFIPIAFELLINKNYNDAYNLIPLAIIATEFQVFVGMYGTIYIAKNNTKAIAISSIISAIINIVSDLLLVKFVGVYAAIISTVLSYFILFIYRMYDVNKKYFSVKFDKKLLLNMLSSILIVGVLYYVNNIIVKIINIIISLVLLLIFNFDSIKYFKNVILERMKNNERKNC